MTQLTKTQLKIAADMLDLAYEEFVNHGCNDYWIDATPDNLKFVHDMIAASDYPEDMPHLSRDGKSILLMEWGIMIYCRDLLRKAAESVTE